MDDASATDNCGEVTIAVVETTIAGLCAGDYSITRVFTATDDCGNATSATQTITIVDTTAPVFTSVPADYTAECSDAHPMDDASATDNCGEVTISVVATTIPGACAGDYSITRAFTATDDCGNASSSTQTITIVDTTNPVFTGIPTDYTIECDETLVLEDATAVDNCSGCVAISSYESSVSGYGIDVEAVLEHTDGALSGMTTYRLYLTAPSGSDQVTSFTGNDEFPLSLTTSTSFYQNAVGGATPTDITSAALALAPDLAYDSWVSVGLTQAPEAGEGSVDLIPGDWSTSFEEGSSFTVNDGIGSGWNIAPPTATNGLAGSDNRVLFAQLTTDGNLSGSFRTQVFPNGDQVNDVRADISFNHTIDCSALMLELSESTVTGCGSSYVLTRTWTATDDCDNASSATQTITVVDTTAPVLSIPADYTAECSDAHPMDDASATDNCGEVTIAVVETTIPGACAGDYSITRAFTATDDCGNATSATQTITIVDTTAPVLTSQLITQLSVQMLILWTMLLLLTTVER